MTWDINRTRELLRERHGDLGISSFAWLEMRFERLRLGSITLAITFRNLEACSSATLTTICQSVTSSKSPLLVQARPV